MTGTGPPDIPPGIDISTGYHVIWIKSGFRPKYQKIGCSMVPTSTESKKVKVISGILWLQE
jgi:hypothetical protein